MGPRRTNRNLVGIGTSVRSPKNVGISNRTNADIVLSKKSTSPTRIFDASEPGGIFLMKLILL